MARRLPVYLDAVVSIEVGSIDKTVPVATGFLFGRRTGELECASAGLHAIGAPVA